MFFVEEEEDGAGRELKRSTAECASGGLDTAGLLLRSGTHPPPLHTAGLGASRRQEMEAWLEPSHRYIYLF